MHLVRSGQVPQAPRGLDREQYTRLRFEKRNTPLPTSHLPNLTAGIPESSLDPLQSITARAACTCFNIADGFPCRPGALERGDRAVIADLDGSYLKRSYQAERGDRIHEPIRGHDERGLAENTV